MQRERVCISAELDGQERHVMSHKPRDEMHVARKPIKFGDGDRAAFSVTTCRGEGVAELRAAI
jgi:hypothetical protein